MSEPDTVDVGHGWADAAVAAMRFAPYATPQPARPASAEQDRAAL